MLDHQLQLIELISIHRNETGVHVMNFVAVMFGYVATAFFVGKQLSKFQVSAITILYTFFTVLPTLAGFESAKTLRALQGQYIDFGGELVNTSLLTAIAPEAVAGTIIMSWIISVVFMSQARKIEGRK